jgi:hypothetical protein
MKMKPGYWSGRLALAAVLVLSGGAAGQSAPPAGADTGSEGGRAPVQVFTDENVRSAPPPIMRYRGGGSGSVESEPSAPADSDRPQAGGDVFILF